MCTHRGVWQGWVQNIWGTNSTLSGVTWIECIMVGWEDSRIDKSRSEVFSLTEIFIK